MSYDENRDLLATAYGSRGLTLWDVSDPARPRVLWSDPDLEAARVAVRGNLMQVYGLRYEEAWTYDITDPSGPTVIDTAFWDPSNSWNQNCRSANNYDTIIHPTEPVMYAARFALDQVIDTSACVPEVAPRAGVSVDPVPAFAGDLLTVTNTSTGSFDRSAIWITSTSDPHGTVVSGSDDPAAGTPSFREFPIPEDPPRDASYWAHVAVETDDFPYTPGSTPGQIDSVQVDLDRTPGGRPDGGPGDAGLDASPGPVDEGGGCGCRVTPQTGAPALDWAPLLFALSLLPRRLRRRRRASGSG